MGSPARIMVVSCDSCGSRFRFDRSLFGGTAGARLRCRRCGGFIDVRNPEATVQRRTVEPRRRPGDVGPGPTPTIGGSSRTAQVDRQEKPRTPSPPSAVSPEPAKVGTVAVLRFERSAGKYRKSRLPRKVSLVPYIAVVLGMLLLGIAGLGYIRSATGERKLDKATVSGPAVPGIPPGPGDRFEFDRVETYYHRTREAGSIYVLKGRVADVGGAAGKGRIQVHASVLNPDRGLIEKKTVYAGNMVSDEDLIYRDRAYVERALSGNGDGGAQGGNDMSPGTPLPFMVVFFEVPNNLADYQLTADRTTP